MTVTTGGVVLCGGRSRRMGRSKADLPFGPETMLQRVVRLLGTVVEPIVVVAAPEQELPVLPENVLVARDRKPENGPLEGMAAGLELLVGRVEAAYVTSCDVPLLVPGYVREMIEKLGDAEIAVPRTDGYLHPLAAIYRLSILPRARELLDAERRRPAFLFEGVKTHIIDPTQLSADPKLLTLQNLNEPADYFAALQQAGLEVDAEVRASMER